MDCDRGVSTVAPLCGGGSLKPLRLTAIQRFLEALHQFLRHCVAVWQRWRIGSEEGGISLSVEETAPASSYQSSVTPWFGGRIDTVSK
ncbi:hypothetical protein AOLI_G00167730 [Acnodon oligacanthus]